MRRRGGGEDEREEGGRKGGKDIIARMMEEGQTVSPAGTLLSLLLLRFTVNEDAVLLQQLNHLPSL